MDWIAAVRDREALCGTPVDAATEKVPDRLTPLCHRWIEVARF